ncbi:MAG TPA: type II secretion system protein GspM [Aquabacterium sp.]|nr:type II secretion system protein GspM [Aquabacterium sp.]
MSRDAWNLQTLQQAWQTRLAGLAPRERRLVTAAIWLAALALLVMVAIRPAWRTLRETPPQLRELEGQLDQMRRLAEETRVLRQRPPVPPVQAEAALKAATDRLGAGARLTVQGDRATLVLNGVAGEALASWLDEVRAGARARPLEANLQQSAVGVYNGSVTLALGPGSTPP